MKDQFAYLILGFAIGTILTTWFLKLLPWMKTKYWNYKDWKRKPYTKSKNF